MRPLFPATRDWSSSSRRWRNRFLFVGLDAAAVQVLESAGVYLVDGCEGAPVVAAQAQRLLEDEPANTLGAGRSGERAKVGPVAGVGGNQASGADHVGNLYCCAGGRRQMGPES